MRAFEINGNLFKKKNKAKHSKFKIIEVSLDKLSEVTEHIK